MLLVFTLVFSVVFRARWGIGVEETKTEFAIILFVGMIIHGLFSDCVNSAPGLILSNVKYVKILGWFVKDRLGQSLFGEHTYTYVNPPLQVNAGEKIKAVFEFQMPLLPNGEYAMTVSIAEGDPFEHTQHHWLHDALILKVTSDKLRYGLVGISFNEVSLTFIA